MMGYRQKLSGTMHDILYGKSYYCYLNNRHGENVAFEKRRMRRKFRRDLEQELDSMIQDELTLDELELIHNIHNMNMDCDCEDCREYRRRVKDDNSN